jgi:hypothetical protein
MMKERGITNSAEAATAGGEPGGTGDDESVPSAGLVAETHVMPEHEPGRGDPIRA